MLGVFRICGGRCPRAYHIAGTDDVLADGNHNGKVAMSRLNYIPLPRLHRGRRRVWDS